MRNDLPPELGQEEMERNAYNAAFYELGLHWHWDSKTFSELKLVSPQPEVRIRHYLETAQPHLLQAYDADFLAAAILERKRNDPPCTAHSFDWARAATFWQLGGA